MSTRILIFGNSGSGKSTLAARLVAQHCIAHLDLDSIVWEPGLVAVQRAFEHTCKLLAEFIAGNQSWVIEGCYGELIRRALPSCTRLLFLNPGTQACLLHNESRPWEPHKYESLAAQNEMLTQLQEWVSSYRQRADDWSYAAHRQIFDDFAGEKLEICKPDEIQALGLRL